MECAICYNRLQKFNLAVTSCKHSFCLDCMLKHYSNSKSYSKVCPICRESLHKRYPPTPPNSPSENSEQPTYIDCIFQPNNYFVTYDSHNDEVRFHLPDDSR